MTTAIVKKAFENYDKNPIPTSANYTRTLDKFALKAFNKLSHDRKVSRPLVASSLLDLPDHYFSKAIVKSININFLKIKFSLILSSRYFNQSDDIICANGGKVRPYLMYKYYIYCGLTFAKVSIYEYI